MKKLVRVAVLIAACACVGVFVLQSQSRDLQDDDGIVFVNGRWHVPETVMEGPFIARRTPQRPGVHFDINEGHPLVPLHAPPVVNVGGIKVWEAERWPADVVAAFQTDLKTEARKKCLAALTQTAELTEEIVSDARNNTDEIWPSGFRVFLRCANRPPHETAFCRETNAVKCR